MNKPEFSWLQISIKVDAELAEAVADVFGRYIESGVVIESTRIESDADSEGMLAGSLLVSAYIPADGQLEDIRGQIEKGLRALAIIQPLPEASYSPVKEENWMEAWKAHFRPLPVGKRLLVLPAWIELDPGDRLPIRIDPGMAFGTGVHPTTQLSLQLLEAHVHPGVSLIDMGSGSGILSIAAARLGAAPILGLDIDPAAVDNARRHATLNEVTAEFALGSLDEVLQGEFSLKHADIVVANILAPVLIRLLDAGLGELLASGGKLLLSGILEEQLDGVHKALQAASLDLLEERKMGDWRAIVAAKKQCA